MSDFKYLSFIKRQAKLLAKTKSIKLSAAQAAIASQGGFDHYHELQKVAAKNPNDIRLMRLAFQTNDDLTEVVYGDGIYEQIGEMLESELSSSIAGTNADGFCIDEFNVEKADYDQSTGVLSTYAEISYAGDQKQDRPYSGTAFYLSVVIRLHRLVDSWEFLDTGSLQINEIESDQDRDWEQQQLEKRVADAVNNTSLASLADAVNINPALMSSVDIANANPSLASVAAQSIDASLASVAAQSIDASLASVAAQSIDASLASVAAQNIDASLASVAAQNIDASLVSAADISSANDAIERLRKSGLI